MNAKLSIRRAYSLWQKRSFSQVSITELKKGDWIENHGKIMIVQSITSTQSGRGSRIFHLQTKEPLSDVIHNLKPLSKEVYERLEMTDRQCKFMYRDNDVVVVMDDKSLDEYILDADIFDPKILPLMEGGSLIRVRFLIDTNKPILASTQSNKIKCTVSEILETREGSDKRKSCTVKVQGGARVVCSLAISPGESIIVNADDLSYCGRV